MGPFFQNFRVLAIQKIVKNGPIFQEKSLKMDTFFCQNDPYVSKGFKAQATDSCPNQIPVPQPPLPPTPSSIHTMAIQSIVQNLAN